MKLYMKIIIISAVILVMAFSILLPNIFFKLNDNATLEKVEKQSIETVDLTINQNLDIYEKLYIMSHDYQLVDLTSEDDPSEHDDFSLMFDDALAELNVFFEPWDVSFNESDVTSVEIYKYLYTSLEDSSSFTGWSFIIHYPAFTVSLVLDNDSFMILSLELAGTFMSDYMDNEAADTAYESTDEYTKLTEILSVSTKADLDALLCSTVTEYYSTEAEITEYGNDSLTGDATYTLIISDSTSASMEYIIQKRKSNNYISFNYDD